jgi:hypothetical protein
VIASKLLTNLLRLAYNSGNHKRLWVMIGTGQPVPFFMEFHFLLGGRSTAVSIYAPFNNAILKSGKIAMSVFDAYRKKY